MWIRQHWAVGIRWKISILMIASCQYINDFAAFISQEDQYLVSLMKWKGSVLQVTTTLWYLFMEGM